MIGGGLTRVMSATRLHVMLSVTCARNTNRKQRVLLCGATHRPR